MLRDYGMVRRMGGNGMKKRLADAAVQIDGEKLKPDTWYMLKNGEFVETEE